MIEIIKNISKDKSTFIFVSSVKITESMKSKIAEELNYNSFLQRASKNNIYVYRMEKFRGTKEKKGIQKQIDDLKKQL